MSKTTPLDAADDHANAVVLAVRRAIERGIKQVVRACRCGQCESRCYGRVWHVRDADLEDVRS